LGSYRLVLSFSFCGDNLHLFARHPILSTMKATIASALLGALSAICVHAAPVVDETYPYTGPAVPVGDWVDPTVNGNGKGFPRLVEPPAVKPARANPTNNINVISLSYLPQGINIHYQTPFGLGVAPSVRWGISATNLNRQARGSSQTYVINNCYMPNNALDNTRYADFESIFQLRPHPALLHGSRCDAM
jgi:hypothetical protein